MLFLYAGVAQLVKQPPSSAPASADDLTTIQTGDSRKSVVPCCAFSVRGAGEKFTNPNVDKNKKMIYNANRKRALSGNGQSPSGEEVTAGVASRGGYFLLLYDWITRLHALMITNRSCKTSEVVIRQAPFQGATEVAPIKRGLNRRCDGQHPSSNGANTGIP